MKKFTISLIIGFVLIGTSLNAQWVEVDSGYESPWIFYGMSFPEGQSDVGYIAGMYTTYDGDGVILKTEDGGLTWTTNYGGTSGTIIGLQAICFTSADVGYAGGWDDDLLYTDDGGDTWTTMTVGSGIWYFTDIEFWDEDNGVACASMDGGGQPVFITDDGGDTWTQATSGISQQPLDITYADANTLYLVGNGSKISKSTDGGYTWTDIYTAGGITFGVDFEGTSFGVVGGEDGEMLATTNGGNSWSSYATGYENLWAAKAFTGDSAYIGGTDENMYKTIDGGSNWSMAYNGSGSSNFYKIIYSQNGTGHICGSGGKILYNEAPLNAEFEADQTEICTGTSVNFTDLSGGASSWSWTFEGGTPSTSTDQNPTVTYNSAGVYDVELEVSDGVGTQTEIKFDYIVVLETPAQASAPDGEEMPCTSNYYQYTTDEVDYATDYEWELSPASAGTIESDGNSASLLTADDWTGDFTIRVRATNMCGDGAWSDELECTLNQSPDEFTLEGGGGYCVNGDGVEITLSGSQADIDYELYLDGEATGNIVEGTGSELSFGLVTDEGYYTCMGSNDNCSQSMTEQVEVSVLFPPLEPETPTGPDAVCNNEDSDYESDGSVDADSYEWTLTPEDAGTITANGLEATVEWNAEFSGMAYVSLYGINDCGDGNPSTELEVSVEATPSPEINGPDEVCDNTSELYSVVDNETSTYTWEVSGGTIADGQGTNAISVDWGEAGDGTVTVTEETENGCSGSSESFEVFIDDCTGIIENSDNNIIVYPNPAKEVLNIKYDSKSIVNARIVIINQIGQQMIEKEIIGNGGEQIHQVNISSLTDGLYIFQVQAENNVVLKKQFIKK